MYESTRVVDGLRVRREFGCVSLDVFCDDELVLTRDDLLALLAFCERGEERPLTSEEVAERERNAKLAQFLDSLLK